MKSKSVFFNVVAILSLIPIILNATPTVKLAWSLEGVLKNPESAVFDAKTQAIYVSNVNGDGATKDGNGFISQIDPSGKVKKANWVEGLNAPKGIAIVGNDLWVSDIDELVQIDIAKAKVVKKIPFKDAKFLNDTAATAEGIVFVSDTVANQVYKYDGTNVTTLKTKGGFDSPNGMMIYEGRLYVASWGFTKSMSEKPKIPGKIFSVNFNGGDKKVISKPFGNLDGLEKWNNYYVVTDWMAGKLYLVDDKTKVETLIQSGKQGFADLGLLRGSDTHKIQVLVPQMTESKLLAFDVSE